MKNMISTISNNYGVSEVFGNCIIHPTQEKQFPLLLQNYACFRKSKNLL